MALKLTSLFKTVNDIKKSLFFDTDESGFGSLIFKNLDTVLLSLDTGFYVAKNTTDRKFTDKDQSSYREQRRLSIANEDIDLDSIVPITTHVEFANERFTIANYVRPRGSTKLYRLILESDGVKAE